MSFKTSIAALFFSVFVMAGSMSVHAFMGDYISTAEGDMALIATIKGSDIEYESDHDDSGDIDRRIFSIALSKSIRSKGKLFSSINYGLMGKLPINDAFGRDVDADLEHGYGISAGGSYLFWEQERYALQGYGQINFTFEDTFEYSGSEITFDGHELLIGVTGLYRVLPRLHIYAALELVPYSNFSMEIDGDPVRDKWDLERDHPLGASFGLLYDLETWFVKMEVAAGSERSLGISGGIKL